MNKIEGVENILREIFCEYVYEDIVYRRCAEMIVRKIETGSILSQKHTNNHDKIKLPHKGGIEEIRKRMQEYDERATNLPVDD